MSQASHASWASMREALHAEWTKLRTAPGTLWLLLAVVALTVALSAGAAAAVRCPSAGCGQDPARISLTGIELGQVIVAVLAVLVISGEYGTGMIRTTLAELDPRQADPGGVLSAARGRAPRRRGCSGAQCHRQGDDGEQQPDRARCGAQLGPLRVHGFAHARPDRARSLAHASRRRIRKMARPRASAA